MTLQQIINLKPSQTFLYEGSPARVVWTSFVRESMGFFKRGDKEEEIFSNDFNIFFSVEGRPEGITLHSSWPHPETCEMEEFQLT